MPIAGEPAIAGLRRARDRRTDQRTGGQRQHPEKACSKAQGPTAADFRDRLHRQKVADEMGSYSAIVRVLSGLPYDSPVQTTAHRRCEGGAVAQQIPMVDYLVLGDSPHLVANECTDCGAKFFDRRNACASCGGTSFKKTDIATEGEIRSFTIVTAFIPGADNYVPVVVDLGGTSVRGQLINTPAEAANIALGQKVRLTTYSIGADTAGTEAINYGFEPVN